MCYFLTGNHEGDQNTEKQPHFEKKGIILKNSPLD